jgi:phosphonate transport system permease protein
MSESSASVAASESVKPPAPPPRFTSPPWWTWIACVAAGAFVLQGLGSADITPERLARGASNLGEFLGQAFPPDFSRGEVLAKALYETLQMAVVGVGFGVILSLPVALLAAANTAPHAVVRTAARTLISVSRTIPDLVWAMVFLVAVGFGPLAGILAIAVDTVGFCGRFFAERIEEIKPGPAEALASTGASRAGVVVGAILPEAFPSFVATGLFSVEKAVRAAVVLGLVGAGGIGVELRAAMNLFQYQQALAVILLILVVVIGIEQVSARIRRRLL